MGRAWRRSTDPSRCEQLAEHLPARAGRSSVWAGRPCGRPCTLCVRTMRPRLPSPEARPLRRGSAPDRDPALDPHAALRLAAAPQLEAALGVADRLLGAGEVGAAPRSRGSAPRALWVPDSVALAVDVDLAHARRCSWRALRALAWARAAELGGVLRRRAARAAKALGVAGSGDGQRPSSARVLGAALDCAGRQLRLLAWARQALLARAPRSVSSAAARRFASPALSSALDLSFEVGQHRPRVGGARRRARPGARAPPPEQRRGRLPARSAPAARSSAGPSSAERSDAKRSSAARPRSPAAPRAQLCVCQLQRGDTVGAGLSAGARDRDHELLLGWRRRQAARRCARRSLTRSRRWSSRRRAAAPARRPAVWRPR